MDLVEAAAGAILGQEAAASMAARLRGDGGQEGGVAEGPVHNGSSGGDDAFPPSDSSVWLCGKEYTSNGRVTLHNINKGIVQ